MAIATRCASLLDAAPVTLTVINFVAPSPSLTTCWARSSITLSKYWENFKLLLTSTPEVPVAAQIKESEVDVSLSTVMQLKVLLVMSLSSFCKSICPISASVKI